MSNRFNINSVIDRVTKVTEQAFSMIDSTNKIGSFPHKAYKKIFPSCEFTLDDIKSKEYEILNVLKHRISECFDDMPIKNTFEQAMRLHSEEYYLFVCSTIYPQIEKILFTEILEENPNWLEQFDDLNEVKFHIHSKQIIKGVTKSKEYEYPKFLKNGGLYHSCFFMSLKKAFNNFQYFNQPMYSIEADRNLYCHGVKNTGNFLDSLNALLLLDMTLQSISKYKGNNILNLSNSTPLGVSR